MLRRAAAKGDPTAAGSLGYAYDVGQGIRRDTTLALMWYRRAARLGNTTAATNIATVYRDQGKLRLAHRWLLLAAKMGDGDAAVTAGYSYLHGIGVRRDLRPEGRRTRPSFGILTGVLDDLRDSLSILVPRDCSIGPFSAKGSLILESL